jgi:hypothetical protein
MASDASTPTNLDDCLDILNCGGRVAVPFSLLSVKHEPLPETWHGFPVVDGDEHDRVWTRPKGCVLGLRFKGDKTKRAGGCKDYCLYHSGHGRFDGVKGARLFRTRLLMESRKLFFEKLCQEIEKLQKKHPEGLGIRLNVFSDLAWETSGWGIDGVSLMVKYPTIQWFDYTKIPKRVHQFLAGTLPPNYSLVFSYNKVQWPEGHGYDSDNRSNDNGPDTSSTGAGAPQGGPGVDGNPVLP